MSREVLGESRQYEGVYFEGVQFDTMWMQDSTDSTALRYR